ncbi:MAG: GNAT family N-acetyltransferase [Microbacteriaceae bacterium]
MPVALTLTGERVLLNAVVARDKYAVYEYCQDAAIQNGITIPSPYQLKDADYFVGDYATAADEGRGVTLWAIRSPDGGKLRGAIELRHDPAAGASVGFWLGAEFRGAGMMTEALSLVLDHALSSGIRRVSWSAIAGNVPSAIVARRNGFSFEGVTRLGVVFRGERHDSWEAGFVAGDDRSPKGGWPAEVTGA